MRAKHAFELASYLWENHIEIYDSSHVFIMGVGTAYASIVQLLKANDRCRAKITKIFSFISDQDAMHSYKAATDDFLDRWYPDTSMIFVAENHYIWEKARSKPLSKRWGTLIQSPKTEIQEMLELHKNQVIEEMLEITEDWRGEQKALFDADELSAMDTGISDRGLTVDDVLSSPERSNHLPPMGNFALRSPIKGKSARVSPSKR